MKRSNAAPVLRFPAAPVRARRSRWKIALWTGLAAVSALAILIVVLAIHIATHVRDETHPADVIVVFGAAEYSGRPSPVLRARLDHAFDLYRRGIAPVVIITGGFGGDPHFSEGGVGRDYLSRLGVPDSSLIAETQSADTAESAERVSAILRANGWHSVDAVSDAYHLFRVKQFLYRRGVVTYASPRPDSIPKTNVGRATAALRESVSLIFWEIVSLGNW
jgi:uncharacterized SAM-binding protein YcdF (DUF218 family)